MIPCPDCGSNEVYRYKKPIDAGGGYGPDLLPHLGKGWFSTAKFLPVVCAQCGYTRFYATKEARSQLSGSKHWQLA